MKRALIAAALLLASCASTPKSDIAALEVGLTAAETAALAYVRLPRCPAPGLCSDDDIVSRIRDYSHDAYVSVVAARSLTHIATSSSSDVAKALQSAQVAVGAFQQLVGGLP